MHFFDVIIFGIIDNGVLIIGALFGLSIEKYLPKYFHKGIGTVFGAGIGNAVSDFLGGVPIAIDFAWGTFVGCITTLIFIPIFFNFLHNEFKYVLYKQILSLLFFKYIPPK